MGSVDFPTAASGVIHLFRAIASVESSRYYAVCLPGSE